MSSCLFPDFMLSNSREISKVIIPYIFVFQYILLQAIYKISEDISAGHDIRLCKISLPHALTHGLFFGWFEGLLTVV